MLQISTGKFFTSSEVTETFHRGILFTNYRSMHVKRWDVKVATLLASTNHHGLSTFTYEMLERWERRRDDGSFDFIASVGAATMPADLAAILSFALNITCVFYDQNQAVRLLEPSHQVSGHDLAPQAFIKRAFDHEVISKPGDEATVLGFVEQLLALERNYFEGALRAIHRYVNGTRLLLQDKNLAYATMVMSIEALAQEFDGYMPVWSDYEDRKRKPIDLALDGIEGVAAENVRAAILMNEHVALRKRYRDFALKNTSSAFYREETIDAVRPISRRDLGIALTQAYDVRSKYLHTLTEIPEILSASNHYADYELFNNKPLLTFQGLARVCRNLIRTFVMRSPIADVETVDYRKSAVRAYEAQLHSTVWMGHPEAFGAATAATWLTGGCPGRC